MQNSSPNARGTSKCVHLIHFVLWQPNLQVEDLGPCTPDSHQKRASSHDVWLDNSWRVQGHLQESWAKYHSKTTVFMNVADFTIKSSFSYSQVFILLLPFLLLSVTSCTWYLLMRKIFREGCEEIWKRHVFWMHVRGFREKWWASQLTTQAVEKVNWWVFKKTNYQVLLLKWRELVT